MNKLDMVILLHTLATQGHMGPFVSNRSPDFVRWTSGWITIFGSSEKGNSFSLLKGSEKIEVMSGEVNLGPKDYMMITEFFTETGFAEGLNFNTSNI